MGLLDKFNEGPTINGQSLEGKTPITRAGSLNTSQMHAQGNMGDEAEGFGVIDKGFIASSAMEATNLGYKKTGDYSKLDLDGATPITRAGAQNTSQMHAQGSMGDEAPGFGVINSGFIASSPVEATNLGYKTGEYSKLDLDGGTPGKYSDNIPQ